MIHKIKVDAEEYKLISKRIQNFEIRHADRPYRIGDTIVYREFDGFDYTGREVRRRISTVMTEMEGLEPGYVILSLELKIGRPCKKEHGGTK